MLGPFDGVLDGRNTAHQALTRIGLDIVRHAATHMTSNLEKYKKDLSALIASGEQLYLAIQFECDPAEFEKAISKELKSEAKDVLAKLPSFGGSYQTWYSEAKALIRQVLPDRLSDFVRHYEKPKPRKDISCENYRIEDHLQGITVTRGYDKEKVVGLDAAIPHFRQQLNILKAVKARFESSLFDIRQLVQSDLFDSELESAGALAKSGFNRAAGAVAGVVLEKHLGQVCDNHSIKVSKKNRTIRDLNDLLKQSDVIEVHQWRFIQHLGDVRNLCDHDKKVEPTREQVSDLIEGVAKVVKTLF